MATHRSPEEKTITKIIESAPFDEEIKKTWTAQIQENGLTVELLETIHKQLSEIPKDKFASDWQHAKFNMDFAGSLKRWQLGEASRKFKRNR